MKRKKYIRDRGLIWSPLEKKEKKSSGKELGSKSIFSLSTPASSKHRRNHVVGIHTKSYLLNSGTHTFGMLQNSQGNRIPLLPVANSTGGGMRGGQLLEMDMCGRMRGDMLMNVDANAFVERSESVMKLSI